MEVVHNIKCVVIGSKSVGKTSLLNCFVTGPDSSTSPFDNLNGIKVQLEENEKIYQLELWDTMSADHQKPVRRIYYENCDVILVCYSVMDHESFAEVKRKWKREIKKCCPSTPCLLVGTKSDLRQDRVSLLRLDRLQNLKPVAVDDGLKMAKKISAETYLECSGRSGDGLREIFRKVIEIFNHPSTKDETSCNIL